MMVFAIYSYRTLLTTLYVTSVNVMCSDVYILVYNRRCVVVLHQRWHTVAVIPRMVQSNLFNQQPWWMLLLAPFIYLQCIKINLKNFVSFITVMVIQMNHTKNQLFLVEHPSGGSDEMLNVFHLKIETRFGNIFGLNSFFCFSVDSILYLLYNSTIFFFFLHFEFINQKYDFYFMLNINLCYKFMSLWWLFIIFYLIVLACFIMKLTSVYPQECFFHVYSIFNFHG